MCLFTGCTAEQGGIAQPLDAAVETLDGATGNFFSVDLNRKSLNLLKETVYDPQTGAGKSWFTLHWTDATTVTEVSEQKNFAGIKGPVVADFHGIDAANVKALAQGKPFVARVAVIMGGAKDAPGVSKDNRKIVSWFTPDAGVAPRSGTIEVRGKAVKVTLRRRHARIYLHRPLTPKDLAIGFWKTTVNGKDASGKFVIDRMEVSSIVDPRTTDDPALPRVLVVGDSISMNYHNAAQSALKGVANYHRIEGNSFSTVYGVKNMERWLGDYKKKGLHWDVIQFNHGLHDLKQAYDATNKKWGKYSVPLEDYKKGLEKEIAILKKTGARLIWCSTTPVQNSNTGKYARRKGAAADFNQAALEVMRKHPEIQINDLHQYICQTKAFDKWRTAKDVHFWDQPSQELIGKVVVKAVIKALKSEQQK